MSDERELLPARASHAASLRNLAIDLNPQLSSKTQSHVSPLLALSLTDFTVEENVSSNFKQAEDTYKLADGRLGNTWSAVDLQACLDVSKEDLSHVRIGVVDTGAYVPHDDLQGKNVQYRSYVRDCHAFADGHGHGTHCLTIVAEFAPTAHFFVARALDDEGQGSVVQLVQALEWLEQESVRVIALSLGMATYDDALFRTVTRMTSNGTIFLCAAANEGQSHTFNIAYPARIGSVLCIGR